MTAPTPRSTTTEATSAAPAAPTPSRGTRAEWTIGLLGLWVLAQAACVGGVFAVQRLLPDHPGDNDHGWSPLVALLAAPPLLVVGLVCAVMTAAQAHRFPGRSFVAASALALAVVHAMIVAQYA